MQPAPRPKTTDEQKLDNLFRTSGGTSEQTDSGVSTVEYTKSAGSEGSKLKPRSQLLHALVHGGSSSQEGIDGRFLQIAYGLSWVVWNEYQQRQFLDTRWCDAFAAAAARQVRGMKGPSHVRVCVQGLGSCVAALSAASEGADVAWLVRVARYAEIARRIVERARPRLTRGGGSIEVHRVKEWGDFHGTGFDVVVTEEVSDDLLGDGILPLCRHAHKRLLRLGGSFVPSRATVYAAIASIRLGEVSGFDLSAFNAFRCNDSVWIDIEHIKATDMYGKQGAALLSAPVALFSFDFSSAATLPTAQEAAQWASATATATADGVVNCITWWYELDLGGGGVLDLGPNLADPRPFESRARRQVVVYLGYERQVRRGEPVLIRAAYTETRLRVDAPADTAALSEGRLVRWPSVNLLAYHFSMIADEGRNGVFDRALTRAIARFVRSHDGRRPRVLDIGSGSGLLAMMAARAGALEVHSLEMVPALAQAARHIVAANGYSKAVTIHSVMSTDLDPATVGGRFDLLVCEIVDDQLLGEGVLSTVHDARRRLLKPGAILIPNLAEIYALPVSLRIGERAGFHLEDINLLATDMALSPRAHTGCKLQRRPISDGATVLGPPVRLFDFDFAAGDVAAYLRGRSRSDLSLRIETSGTLTAVLLFFHLHCGGGGEGEGGGGGGDDSDGSCTFSTGPHDNKSLTAWDQSLRVLPIELAVTAGESLHLTAEHNHEFVRVGLPSIRPDHIDGVVGHHELFADGGGAGDTRTR